jgi:hypothetical protein
MLGYKPVILYENDNKNYINEIKLSLIELNLSFMIMSHKKDIDLSKFKNLDNIFIKTNRVLLSSGKIFLSSQHLEEDVPSTDHFMSINKIKNLENFKNELDFFYLYEKE